MASLSNGPNSLDPARTSDAAHAAWSRIYTTRRITLARGDPEPFKTGRRLGRGGWSDVFETDLDGTAVALKQVFFRNSARERPRYLNELNVLEKISGKRHRHVVELIGCYELPHRSNSQLGILVWPVAQCDLSRFLGSIDIVHDLKCRLEISPILEATKRFAMEREESGSWKLKQEEQDALEELSDLTMLPWRDTTDYPRSELLSRVTRVCAASVHRLYTVFGCLAQAIAYLHDDQKIRHKDIKPAQVLLSPNGLWLTDFGWSADVSELSNSATNNGAVISTKYHSPERATRGQQFCGRSEDIFSLGCTYLEMAYRVCGLPVEVILNPEGEKGWSYQANLSQLASWVNPLLKENARLVPLVELILRMMAHDPNARPNIQEVVDALAVAFSDKHSFFGPCCLPSV